jgi:hypothetical protein
MKKTILLQGLKFGLLAGGACFVFFLALRAVHPNPLLVRRPDIGINVILIWAAIWYYKRFQGGFLHFYEGFSIGFVTNVVAALFTGILLFIFCTFVDQTVFQTWISSSKDILLKDKDTFVKIMNEDNFNRQLSSLSNSKPYILILDDFMFKQLAIVPISLLTMIMRKLNK